jgi:CheY-like chemotaxis protein
MQVWMGTRGGGLALVVEDDDDLREAAAELLRSAGFRVATAREGGEALTRVAQEMPGVIFLDMRMPGMDGWAFAREFRARHDSSAPIVVVTAAANAAERAQEIAADGCLGKPFEIKDLLATAAQYLRPMD